MYLNDKNVTFMFMTHFYSKSRKAYKLDKPWVRKVDMFVQPWIKAWSKERK